MGQGSMQGIVQWLMPWAFVLMLLGSFYLDPEGPFATAIGISFAVIMIGYVVTRAINSLYRLDSVEKAIIAIFSGITVPSSLYAAINGMFSISWDLMLIGLIVPAVMVSMFVMVVLGTEPLLGNRNEGVLQGIMKEYRSLSRTGRLTVSIGVIALMLIASSCVFLIMQKEERGFTEFYVLNQDGHAYGFPRDITFGENITLIIGIANHEGRPVNYTVEMWLVNYTNINMAINVTEMYFVNSFNIILDHSDYDLNGPWSPQYETAITFSPKVSGDFQLFIMLFPDDVPEMPAPGTYDGTTNLNIVPSVSWRVVMCVNNEINHLMLYIDVSP